MSSNSNILHWQSIWSFSKDWHYKNMITIALSEKIFDSGTSKEENSSLKFNSSTSKLIKHSTPVDATLSKSMISIDSISYLKEAGSERGIPMESPLPKTPFLEFSAHPDTKSLKPFGQRKRLSTVSASEESNAEVQNSLNLSSAKQGHQVSDPLTKKKSKISFKKKSKISFKKWCCYGLPGIKDPVERKGRFNKRHVANDLSPWELLQLQNIEEATHHELVIEVTR
ncbi:coiled-coil domain-containing protein 201-like isoform X1 [Sarcophilus harrisii]|uniref:coiled-coil domain-containing protein 201-like isoform X1 n=1 Tax=Sarcophilus harrisii TaxID=9305 RepID=UPI001301AF18|nr:coiled-coil domain-containing protein 201-like isoform X1 [Sarcophilus harrisii]